MIRSTYVYTGSIYRCFFPGKKAQQDEEYLNQFILENRRFIRSIASKATGRFITESDDEWSVALIAFHEAVRSYDDSKGSFCSFAALVIKRRLVDYMASQARHQLEIYVEPEPMDGNVEEETASPFQLEVRSKSAEISEMQDGTAIRDEIEAVQQIELLENAGEIKADTKDSDEKKLQILKRKGILLQKIRQMPAAVQIKTIQKQKRIQIPGRNSRGKTARIVRAPGMLKVARTRKNPDRILQIPRQIEVTTHSKAMLTEKITRDWAAVQKTIQKTIQENRTQQNKENSKGNSGDQTGNSPVADGQNSGNETLPDSMR